MELYASHETGNYKALEQKYGIKIPRALQRNLGGFLARLGDKLATIWRKITGNSDLSSNDVYQMLQDLRNTDVSNSATDNVGAFDENNNDIRHARSEDTKSAYEQRIDELFSGANAQHGTRILDRSDVMDMLGYGNAPLILSESHLRDNLHQNKHPEMTAEQWKKVPEWIENPIIAYENKLDNNKPDRIVLVAPETINGRSVLMAIEPKPKELSNVGSQVEPYQLLVTVFAKDTPLNIQELVNQERLRYVDMKKAPDLWRRVGSQFSKQSVMNQRRIRILTERNLQGYRKNNPFDTNQTENNSNSLKFSRRSTKQDIADIARTGQVPYNKGFIERKCRIWEMD